MQRILTKTLQKKPWPTDSQRTQRIPPPQTAPHTSVKYLSKHAQQAHRKNFRDPSRYPRCNRPRIIWEPQSKSRGYSSTQHKIFLRPYSIEKNHSNKYFLCSGLELWPRGPHNFIPITSKGRRHQGSYTLYLHDAPKHVSLSKNGLWEIQINLWRRHLGSTNKLPPTRPGTRKRSGLSHMGHCQTTPTQLTDKRSPWCSLQMINFRRQNKYGRLLLCQQYHNSSDISLSQHPYRRYSQTLPRRPQHICKGSKSNESTSKSLWNKVVPFRFCLVPGRKLGHSKEKRSPLSGKS